MGTGQKTEIPTSPPPPPSLLKRKAKRMCVSVIQRSSGCTRDAPKTETRSRERVWATTRQLTNTKDSSRTDDAIVCALILVRDDTMRTRGENTSTKTANSANWFVRQSLRLPRTLRGTSAESAIVVIPRYVGGDRQTCVS